MPIHHLLGTFTLGHIFFFSRVFAFSFSFAFSHSIGRLLLSWYIFSIMHTGITIGGGGAEAAAVTVTAAGLLYGFRFYSSTLQIESGLFVGCNQP